MDASTTALSVARHLKARGGWSQLTVITNGLRIASELAGHPGIIVLMLGGRVRWEALSVVGQLGDGLFSRINVQKAFLGAAGFTVESGLSDATDEEAQIKRSMVAAAREVIAIVDHTKWERAAFATFCPTDQISIVLTDDGAPDAMVRALAGRGVEVRLIGPDGVGDARRGGLGRARRGRGHDRRRRPWPTAPPRRAARDLEAVRGDAGARRRLARPASPGRSTRSSARTAPARAPSSRSWPASTSPTAGRSCSTARRPRSPDPPRRARSASRWSTRSRGSSRT